MTRAMIVACYFLAGQIKRTKALAGHRDCETEMLIPTSMGRAWLQQVVCCGWALSDLLNVW